jgi:hypothetical protein
MLVVVTLVACSGSGPAGSDGTAAREAGSGDGVPPTGFAVSVKSLDFGKVGCGTPAGAAKAIELVNAGKSPVTWSASLVPATPFKLSEPAKGTLAPGEKTTLNVTPPEVPASATAGNAIQATLTVTSSDPANASVEIPIALTPTGGAIELSPELADFGLVPMGTQAEDVALTLTNAGNAEVTVAIAQPANAAFSVAWTGAPAPAKLAPGATLAGLVARFKPSQADVATASAAITITGAVCGASAAKIALTGKGSKGNLGIQPGALDFGKVNCGATAAPQTVTLTNTGNAAVNYQTALKAGAASPFTVVPATGSIAPAGKTTLTVTPTPIPAVALTGSDQLGDTLTITTDVAGGTPQTVTLHQTAQGARIVAAAPTIAFGNLPVSQTKTATLELSNQGNLAATVTLATTSPFSVTPSTAQVIAPGSKLAVAVAFSPADTNPAAGTLAIAGKTGDVLCAALPPPITLEGTGTKGALAVSVSTIAFGDVDCGKQGVAQSVQILNAGTTGFGWTAALAKGASSWYSLSATSGANKPGDITSIKVTPKAIPATSTPGDAAYADTLTITSDIPGDTPQAIPVSMSARGAVIAFSAATAIDFGKVPMGTSAMNQVTIQNTGTAPASVSLAITGGPVFSLDALGPFAINPTDSETVSAVFEPVTAGAQNATITLSVPPTTVLCGPLPSRSVTGTGTNGTVALSTSSLDFGQTDCGKQATAKSVVLTNPGTARYNFTADLAGTTQTAYTVAPATGFVDPGQSVTLTVTPLAIPNDAAVTPDGFADTLTVTSDAYGDTPHVVAIHQTARGAVLAINPQYLYLGYVLIGASGTGALSVTNTGNAPATVSFSSPQPTMTVTPQGQTVASGGTLAATATFKPVAAGVVQAVVSATVPAGAALCGVLPTVELEGEGDNP